MGEPYEVDDLALGVVADAVDRVGLARTLNNLASAIADGDTTREVALYEEGLGIARAIGEQNLIARFLNNLAIQRRRAGDLRASLTMNQESPAIRREIGDRVNTASRYVWLLSNPRSNGRPAGMPGHGIESSMMTRASA